MSSDPNARVVNARVPVVSDKYVNQPISRWWAFSYVSYLVLVLTLLVGIIGGTFVVGRQVLTVLTHNNASNTKNSINDIHTPNPTPDVQADCLNQLPQSSGKKPALFFCSPKYLGSVAGPFGTHIILVGENFSLPPTGWFLSKQPITNGDALKECSSGHQTDCQSLSSSSLKTQVQSGIFLFFWVWQAPSFPSTKGDYFITAQVGDQPVTTTSNFTLLTSQPPCITISAAENQAQTEVDCTQPNGVALQPGIDIAIKGKNWLLGWNPDGTDPLNIQVEVVASCIAYCDLNQLFDDSGEISSNGTFSIVETLPPNVIGKYTVKAGNKTLVDSPGGQTVVGDSALMDDLILNIP